MNFISSFPFTKKTTIFGSLMLSVYSRFAGQFAFGFCNNKIAPIKKKCADCLYYSSHIIFVCILFYYKLWLSFFVWLSTAQLPCCCCCCCCVLRLASFIIFIHEKMGKRAHSITLPNLINHYDCYYLK